MKKPAAADIQRWSDEVARDPRSLAFLPLARAYRRQGLRELAMELCLRGLEAYPAHADAHGLLALLYLEGGDYQRAADEWSMVLRIDPDNFEALRGIGFCHLQRDEVSRARHALERAALLRPADSTVREALRLLGGRPDPAAEAAPAPEPPAAAGGPGDDGSRPAQLPEGGSGEAAGGTAAPPSPSAPSTVPATAPGPVASAVQDPFSLFDDLLASGALLGALLVDGQGLVLAGRLTDGPRGGAEMLAALLGSAVDEAARTVAHLRMGAWRGILLETGEALLHVSPAEGGVVVLAARQGTPSGWIRRTAAQAGERAARFMEVYG
jgi:tetratricopeptide (TPR) repeat protein